MFMDDFKESKAKQDEVEFGDEEWGTKLIVWSRDSSSGRGVKSSLV